MLGTGFNGQLSGLLETVVADVNGLGVPVVAIDLPTGVSADTHEVAGEAIDASMTVTLAAPKIPLILPPADSHCGDLVIADIGIPLPILDDIEGPAHRDPDPRRHARPGAGAHRRLPQRRLRPRPRHRRLARTLGRRASGGPWRAAIGRRTRDHCDAALVRADRLPRWRRNT